MGAARVHSPFNPVPTAPVCSHRRISYLSCVSSVDPVIHYQSQVGRKQVYGRTDLGRKGMRKFFRTHDCNNVCRLLGLGTRRPASVAVPNAVAGSSTPKPSPGKITQKAARNILKAAKAAAKAAKAAANPTGPHQQAGKGKRRKVTLE